jgi:cytochrome c oxidase subunit 2
MKKKIMLLMLSAALLPAAVLNRPIKVSAQNTPKKIEVTASKFAFAPAELTLKKGEPVVLVLKSADAAHGLKFGELGFNVKVDKGGTAEMALTPDKTGTFVGHCSVFCGSGHGAMTLTLHVVE